MKLLKEMFAFLCIVSVGAEVSQQDVTFAVRNHQNPENSVFVQPIDTSEINPSRPIIIITHGWRGAGDASWIQNLTNAYLKVGDYNVIAMSWKEPANQNYIIAVKNTKDVGNLLGEAVIRISKEKGVSLKQFHLIGHSLGAHVVGFAGQKVKESTEIELNWLTGLDPAGPLFEIPKASRNSRLSDDDGKVVEIIHTDGGILGFHNSLGTIDFYPNGGRYIQPHCATNETLLKEINNLISCSHEKSIIYYTLAVEKLGITATQCKYWELYEAGGCKGNEKAKFGGKKPPKERGSFFVGIDA